MSEIIDRRQTDPDDSDRLARRRTVREMAAKRDIELQPALLAEADIEQSKLRADGAADRHAATCEPWQTELRELEARAVARIGRREEPDEEEDRRRAELVGLISEATRELEATIKRERETQSELARKARRLRQARPPTDTILLALGKPPLASPALLVKQHVVKQRIAAASGRIDRARAALRIAESNLDGIRRGVVSGELAVQQHKKACWQAELHAAQEELAQAQRAGEEIHRQMLDE